MPQKTGTYTDSRDQLIMALEYSLLGWYHTLYKGSKHSSADLLQLLNYLREREWNLKYGESQNVNRSVSETSLKGYRIRLKEEFQFYVNFQSGYTEYGRDLNREEKIKHILPLASYYLHTILPSHSDEALLLLLKNISVRQEDGSAEPADPLLALYYICAFRYAAFCGITVDIVYREIMGKQVSSRRLVPLAVVWRSPYINLIARDTKDKKIKQFVISSVLSLSSDLWSKFFLAMTGEAGIREEFSYETYKKDPEYRFLRSIRKYTFRMTGYTFHHFRHSQNMEWELSEKISETNHIVTIISDDWRNMLFLLFNYGNYIKLLNEEVIQKGSAQAEGDYPLECLKAKLPLLCAFRRQINEHLGDP